MATYKVLQDIEAEDKFLGPLTLKQFIIAAITVVSLYLDFLTLVKHLWPITLVLLPVTGFGILLAFPWGRDQPTEVWLLAKIRFFLKPRKRIWDQSGLKELVTITVPKHIEHQLTNNLTQSEVRSRLQALANTIDSRGWAVKNVNVNLYSQPGYLSASTDSDRLIDPASIPQEVPTTVVTSQDDMLDTGNRVAQQFDVLMNASANAHKQELVDRMQGNQPAAAPADYWFMHEAPKTNQPGLATFNQAVVLPGTDDDNAAQPTAEETALLEKMHDAQKKAVKSGYAHLKTIEPLSLKKGSSSAPPSELPSVTVPADPAILELAKNDDLNVATIARQANKKPRRKSPPDDEVEVPLH